MPTPSRGYFLADGTRVPSVTTIIGRFKESDGLMQWAFRQGQEGRSHLYEKAQEAAAIGTIVHSMVEAHMNGADIDSVLCLADVLDPDGQGKALSAFEAYRAWEENFKVKIVAQEIQLVSEIHHFGGTPDAIGYVGNRLCLLDWKTSGAIYSNYLVQLAAYRALWEEANPTDPIEGGYHLLRFSKENGDFAHHHFPALDEAWEQFLLFRRAYDIDKKLKKRAA